MSGAEIRSTSKAMMITTVLSDKDVSAAHSGCPSARPTAELLAA